jgi:hypothetical protein
MPMNFPDMRSLLKEAEVTKFRSPNTGETEDEYRSALADHVERIDFIESMEIRNKVGWDQWNEDQRLDMLQRSSTRKRS